MISIAKLQVPDRSIVSISAAADAWSKLETPLLDNVTSKPRYGTRVQLDHHISRVGISFRVGSPQVAFLAQTGFTNPINLLWEVIPYSFVVDWLLPIGPYLEQLHAWDGLEFVKGFQVRIVKRVTFYDYAYSGKLYPAEPTDLNMVQDSGQFRQEHIIYERDPLTSFPSMTFPTLKNPASLSHALNGLALLHNFFQKKA